ncbi:hypothetical protein [Photobacterium leiognathi]|uniref:hypothetical protein n=1 Tax=Photobacterium leiognathi TaxID=553611 RepID=UPI0029827CF1|nr:hypothetical protein [Photobacterium leiognathi]
MRITAYLSLSITLFLILYFCLLELTVSYQVALVCIAFVVFYMGSLIKIGEYFNRKLYSELIQKDLVAVYHRTTQDNSSILFEARKIEFKKGKVSRATKLIDKTDEKGCFWLSLGEPSFWGEFWGGHFLCSASKRSNAICFTIDPKFLSFPSGFKAIFGSHQVLLNSEFTLPLEAYLYTRKKYLIIFSRWRKC